MNITQYASKQIAPFIVGDDYPPRRSGPELVKLFNKYGIRDVYDELGLPDINKKMGIGHLEKSMSKLD